MHKHQKHCERGKTESLEIAGPCPTDEQDQASTPCTWTGTTGGKKETRKTNMFIKWNSSEGEETSRDDLEHGLLKMEVTVGI